MRTIVAAAILKNGTVYTVDNPARHNHVIRLMSSKGELAVGGVMGFLDSNGDFLTREEALDVAKTAGQVSSSKNALFSEDLW